MSMTTTSYCSIEPYANKFFTTIPIPNGSEALILIRGVDPDLLVTPSVSPAKIRRGKYTQLVRLRTDQQTVSGQISCYCKSQTYQFHISYKAACHVCDPMAAWSSQCPDPAVIAEEYYRSLFSMEAVKHDIQDVASLQNALNSKLQNIQIERGLQIGPLQSVQVDMDAEYRAHLRSMQKDTEIVEAEIHRVKNADQFHNAPITAENAMLRDVLDRKKTLDEMIQESKQRRAEDFAQAKTLLEELNDLRRSGLINEDAYERAVNSHLSQLTAPRGQPPGSQGQLYAPDPEDL